LIATNSPTEWSESAARVGADNAYDVWLSIGVGDQVAGWHYLGRFTEDQAKRASQLFFGRDRGYLYFRLVPTGPFAGL
jgi:hypothetical protein